MGVWDYSQILERRQTIEQAGREDSKIIVRKVPDFRDKRAKQGGLNMRDGVEFVFRAL